MRGITTKLTLSLMLIVSIVLVGFGYLDYRNNETRLNDELNRGVEIVRSRLLTSLPIPIWNYEAHIISKILVSEIPEIFIAGIRVVGTNGNPLGGVAKDAEGKPENNPDFTVVSTRVDKAEIFFEEEGSPSLVGTLELHITDNHITALLKKNMENTLIQVASTDLVILILFFFVLKPIVGPLKYLTVVAGKIAGGDYSAEVIRRSRDEVGDLSESFNTMRKTIQKKMGDLSSINSIGEQLTLTYKRNKALEIVLGRLSKHSHFKNGSIFLWNEASGQYRVQGFYPEHEEPMEPRAFRPGEGIIGLAVQQKQSVFVANSHEDERFVGSKEVEPISLLCVPLIDQDRVIGALNFTGEVGEVVYSEGDEEFMTSIARSLVITLKNIEMREEIEEHNRNLEIKVQERTAALQSKTNDISAMMRNLQQGLFTILSEMSIHHEYSKFLEKIFETEQIANRPFMDLLLADVDLSEDERAQIKVSVSTLIGSDEMMWDFNAHLLPKELVRTRADSKQIFEVDWNPIINEGEIEKIMVTVRDVTELRRLQLEAEGQKRDLEIISQLLNTEPAKFYDFVESARDYIEKNRTLVDGATGVDAEMIQVLFRNMHTVKGNARTYGLTYITECAHLAEATYDEMRKAETPDWNPKKLKEELSALSKEIDHYLSIADDKLGLNTKAESLKGINSQTIQGMIETLRDLSYSDSIDEGKKKTLNAQLRTLYGAVFDSLEDAINDVAVSLPSLAQAVDKPAPKLDLDCDNIYMSKKSKSVLNDVLMHCLRNSIDHGIETPEERQSKGKSAAGQIQVTGHKQGDSVVLTIADDGRGLALGKIRQKAVDQGLVESDSQMNNEAIADLVFHSGLSTAENVTQISGRGVGMDAVRNFLRELGGDIRLKLSTQEFKPYVPFVTEIRLPETIFENV